MLHTKLFSKRNLGSCFLLLLVFAVVFTSCTSKPTDETITTTAPETTTQKVEEALKEQPEEEKTTEVETETTTPKSRLGEVMLSSTHYDLQKDDFLFMEYTVLSKGKVSIAVFNAQEKLVKTILQDAIHSAGLYREIWDGTDRYDNLVPSGAYRIRFTDENGSKELPITVKNRVQASFAELNQNQIYETQPITISYTLEEAGPMDIRIYDAQHEEVAVLEATHRKEAGKHTLDWNAQNAKDEYLPAGKYFVQLAGAQKVHTISFEILPKVLVDSLSYEMHTEQAPSLQINYSVIFDSIVRISIYNDQGVLVRTLLEEQPMDPGDFAMVWDCKDEAGNLVPQGKYTIQLQAEAPGYSTQKTLECTVAY